MVEYSRNIRNQNCRSAWISHQQLADLGVDGQLRDVAACRHAHIRVCWLFSGGSCFALRFGFECVWPAASLDADRVLSHGAQRQEPALANWSVQTRLCFGWSPHTGAPSIRWCLSVGLSRYGKSLRLLRIMPAPRRFFSELSAPKGVSCSAFVRAPTERSDRSAASTAAGGGGCSTVARNPCRGRQIEEVDLQDQLLEGHPHHLGGLCEVRGQVYDGEVPCRLKQSVSH